MAKVRLLKFPGTTAGLADAALQLRAFLEGAVLAARCRYQIELAFDEIAGNIVRHAHPTADVEVAVTLEGPEAVMTFVDDGRPFDASRHTPRALDTDLEHAQIGGLGIGLVRKFATRLGYELTPQRHNRLTVAIPIA